jgi:hypothetical protein
MLRRALRQIRGGIATGLTWAAGWGMLGAIHGLVLGWFKPWHWLYYNPVTSTSFGYAVAGLIAGTGFATLLAARDRAKAIGTLTYRRLAMWGAAGGAIVPVLVHLTRGLTSTAGWGDVAVTSAVTATLGAASALVTLRVARRGLADAGRRQVLAGSDRGLLSEPMPDWMGSESRTSAKSPVAER